MAWDIAITRVAKCRVKVCSTRSAAADCTVISRACHTCGRRVSAAAAQPYQECRELVCTTSIDKDRIRRAIRPTATGHPAQYCAQVSTLCEVEIRSIGT